MDLPALQLTGRRILAVDDDRTNLVILQGILRADGYLVSNAKSGEAALEKYETEQPDLVLLDVMLPGINGFETCRELKRRHGEDCAPIIFVTARNASEDVVEGLAAGGTDYLSKPFQPKEVGARVRAHLHARLLGEHRKLLVQQLTRSNAAKNRFLGIAAHDLRNPLASVRGLTEFLIDGSVGPLSAEQLELVSHIHTASQSMLSLVNELLDLSVIEAGELKLQREPTAVAELVDSAVALNSIHAARKHTRIVFERRTASGTILVDPPKLRQVLDNLLSNAVKFSPPGSTVTVHVTMTAGQCAIAVRDEGPGIPPGERDRLFQDFGRTSVQPTGGEKSTGLGLAICRKIVEAHGGKIDAANLPGRGCEFSLTLPLSQ